MADHLEIEAAKFLKEVGQEFNNEPYKLASKLYAVGQQLQQNGEEDSLHFRIISRALETVVQRYGFDRSILNSLHQGGGSGPAQSEPSAFGGPSGLSGGNELPDQISLEERRTGRFGQYSNSGQGIGGAATRESHPRLAETVFSPPNLGELLVASALTTESPSMTSPTPRNEPNPDSEQVVVGGLHDRNNSMDDLEQDLAVPVEGTPNLSAENVVVGTYAQDSTANDFQQELAVPVEVTTNARGENGMVGGLHALNSINDLQRDIAVPDEGTPPNPRGELVVVGLHALNSSTNDSQQDVAVRVEGTPNPRDDFQEQELAVPFEGTTPNARGGNVVMGLHALNSSRDDFQQELTVPGDRMVDNKRPHEEATKQVETRISQKREPDEGDSLVCPICMEPWTNSGDHRICSLVCGHLFGKSCIKRWLRQNGKKSSRCPQCNKRAKLEDLRPLYVPGTLAVVDGEAQQLAQEKILALSAENVRLKLENEKLHEVVRHNKAKSKLVQAPALQLLGDNLARSDFINVNEPNITSGAEPVQKSRGTLRNRGISLASFESCGGNFQLQSSIDVHGGKVFDMDAESLTVIFSNKVAGCGNSYGLSKMSLLSCTEVEKIALPSGFGTIRDIRLSPSGNGGTGKYSLVAFQGKKLSLVSMESNNIVHSFSLQNPPWSCAWDPYVPYLIYSGLQNGALLILDLRNTESPIATLNGLSIRPIHTLEVVRDQFPRSSYQQFGCREILSASNGGISLWNLDPSVAGSETARPLSVFSDTNIVCTSLVYESSSDTAAASFRRSPLAPTPTSYEWTGQNSSQPLGEASTADIACEEPSHWIFSRRQESSWSQMDERVRLPWMKVGEMVGNKSRSFISRTAIIPQRNAAPRSKSLFACGDEGTNSVWLWDMKSLRLADTLVPHPSPVLDIKNVQICNAALGQQDVLGCVSETTLQIYRRLPWSE